MDVAGGCYAVTVTTPTMGVMTWKSAERRAAQVYSVVGSWTAGGFDEMVSSPEDPDVHTSTFAISAGGVEEFHILVNQNTNLVLYPSSNGDAPGESLVCGPDRKGAKKKWRVLGLPGQLMQITLDLHAEDFCSMVACRPWEPAAGWGQEEAVQDG
mmetsp:Transcript_155694/g.478010  ORF Transcript_155694/g.478010 Transcript_155694/m.478010 type:complete len:155 (+) Transcript_155694:1-465(+)